MKDVHKYLIFSIAAVLAFTIFVVGTFLPYRKSGLYIDALTLSRSARSFSEFMEPYQRALDAASPVGQRELIRNFASTVRSVVERSGEQHVSRLTR